MSQAPGPAIEICTASFNSRAATELCLRSVRHTVRSDVLVRVGDSGSRDGSAEMIRSLAKPLRLEAQIIDEQRKHYEWLDLWYETSDADYLVFVDSDMDFRSAGWLDEMIATARSQDAALVAGKFKPSRRHETGNFSMSVERPEVHLTLLDLERCRSAVSTSFGPYSCPDPDEPGRKWLYDVGAKFMEDLQSEGRVAVAMPSDFHSRYRHWGRLSHWRDGNQSRTFMAKSLLKQLRLRQRLIVERSRDGRLRGPVS